MPPHICPRPCSRLATAAVFLSVGVVQLVVGIILLRSKYVFLLAGPDFWTSCSNIAVGCLLGVSASVWKRSKKLQSTKHTIRRNLLLALLFSALIINATTLGILLLGEGNTMLSIRLEGSGMQSKTYLVSEVLAYAYATSVCSPIVCIVVSIVAMSAHIFRSPGAELKTPESVLKKHRAQSFQWVYTPEMLELAKKTARKVVLTSSSDSSSDEASDETPPVLKKYANSVEDLENVLHRMALGKRDSIVSDSTAMLQQLERRRRNRYNSVVLDNSYMGPVLSRTKDSAMSERNYRTDLVKYDRSPYARNLETRRQSLMADGNTSHESSGYSSMEHFSRQGNQKQNRSPYSTDEVFNEYHNASSELAAENFYARNRKLQENLKTRFEMNDNRLNRCSDDIRSNRCSDDIRSNRCSDDIRSNRCSDDIRLNSRSDDFRNKYKHIAAVHKSSKMPFGINNRNDLQFELHSLKKRYDATGSHEIVSPKDSQKSFEVSKSKEISPASNDCLSPDGSDFADSFDLSRTSTWAGQVIPIEVKTSTAPARLSQKLVPVAAPVVPKRQDSIQQKCSGEVTESNSDGINPYERTLKEDGKGNLSSFKDNTKCKNRENGLEYPKAGSQSMKKYDLSKVVTMSSISEEPSAEASKTSAEVPENSLRQEDSSFTSSSSSQTGPVNKSLSSAETSKGRYQERESPGKHKTPKRKTSKTLRRIWSSSAGSEIDMDFINQVVDADSLIGLSEDDLIARQTRTRSIRKTVEERIKGREIAF